MVYLISYDIKDYSDEANQRVVNVLTKLGAVRCLISEWLLDSPQSAERIANVVNAALTSDDRLLVVSIGAWAYYGLLNEKKCQQILARA